MYLRFVYPRSVDGLRSREGFFQAAAELIHHPLTEDFVVAQIDACRDWFNEHLERSERFSRSKSQRNRHCETKGLSWFKPTAAAHIAKAFEMKLILDNHGYPIEVLKEDRVGYVVYEDEYQIVAEPFSDTKG